MSGMTVAEMQGRFPNLVRVLSDSFVRNPERCDNRARLVLMLQKKGGLDTDFVREALPGVASREFVRAVSELDGDAMMVYRAAIAVYERERREKKTI